MNELTAEDVIQLVGTNPRDGKDYVELVARIMCRMLQPYANPDALGPLARGFEDGKSYPYWSRAYGAVAATIVGFLFMDKVEGLEEDLRGTLKTLWNNGGEYGRNFVRWNYPDLAKEFTEK